MNNSISKDNSTFWDELCGSTLAKQLNIKDKSKDSLNKFDEWYFNFYPYLDDYIEFENVKGKSILEVGLGYGSVSQRLAEKGAIYQGMDIASGPVEMVKHRLKQNDLPGMAIKGDILECPFPDDEFDSVIAIGCYHHTGDFEHALSETFRILKPGGTAIVMVYNAYSYRRWMNWPLRTFRFFLKDYFNIGTIKKAGESERAAYDTGSNGLAAPETRFLSIREIHSVAIKFKDVKCYLENADVGLLSRLINRSFILASLGKKLGLDIYVRLDK